MKHALLAAVLALPGTAGAATLAAPTTGAASFVPAPRALQASPADEVAAGRALLHTDPQKALEHFERAFAAEATNANERWVIRGWIAVGRTNDALDRTEVLRDAGADQALCDYLFGYSFAGKAGQHIAEGTGGLAAMNYGDAVTYFQSALKLDPETYADAWYALADSAWWAAQLDVARDAAQRALELEGSGAREQYMLGKIAFSQYSALAQDEAQKDAAQAHWQTALDSFGAAIEELGKPKATTDRVLLAAASLQRAYVLVWGERAAEAQADYTRAMAYNPSSVNFAGALDQLGEEAFLAALTDASKTFTKLYGKDDVSDATLLWWLGWMRNQAKDFAGAEEAMLLAFEKWPAYANAWWTIASSRYSRQDFDGAADAVFTFQDADATGLTATVQSNSNMNLALLEGMVGHYAGSYERSRDAEKAVRAARLALIQAAALPEHSPYWNNAGLFYRDAGDYMKLKADKKSQALREQYHEASLENYSRALELEPGNPIYLNDTAVILHYCLDRELDRALEMYHEATRRAEAELKRTDLKAGARPGIEIALRDSKNNARLLAKKIEKREREKEKEQEEADSGGDVPPSDG
jgi:hypothetical protein